MARMKSEHFFPTVKGHWEIQHSDDLIDAIRIRQISNYYDRSIRTPHPVKKFGLSADSQAMPVTGFAPPDRVPDPAPIETDSLLLPNTTSTSRSTLHNRCRSETYAMTDTMKGLEAPRQDSFPSTHCNVAASFSNLGISSNHRRLSHESKRFRILSTTTLLETSPLEAQASGVRVGHLPARRTHVIATEVTQPWKPDNCRHSAPEVQNTKPLTPQKPTFIDEEADYSEAILAAMSAATMHGLTFTVPVPNSAAISSTTSSDVPLATPTGYYVP